MTADTTATTTATTTAGAVEVPDKRRTATAALLDSLRGSRDAMSVRRVFGEPIEVDGVTVIPVARVVGGGGGGAGDGAGEVETGSGFGTGFGVVAHPVGVYAVREGQVEWRPAVDVSRLARGGQMLAGLVVVCITLIALRRRR
jgi:uncharacterized spore protein YtfJ